MQCLQNISNFVKICTKWISYVAFKSTYKYLQRGILLYLLYYYTDITYYNIRFFIYIKKRKQICFFLEKN